MFTAREYFLSGSGVRFSVIPFFVKDTHRLCSCYCYYGWFSVCSCCLLLSFSISFSHMQNEWTIHVNVNWMAYRRSPLYKSQHLYNNNNTQKTIAIQWEQKERGIKCTYTHTHIDTLTQWRKESKSQPL